MEATAEAKQATPKGLITKLAEVMSEVDRVPKSGHNTFHNYDYATEADIVAAVRKGLASRKVMLLNDPIDMKWEQLPPTKSGQPQKMVTITVIFTFMDGDSGEQLQLRAFGQGSDSGDKAIYKALTGAVKYLLMKTFLIATGDDPERDDGPVRPPPRPPAQTQAPKPSTQPTEKQGVTSAEAAAAKATEEREKVLRTRRSRLWKTASTEKQMNEETFKKWSVSVLGVEKPSASWLPSDLDKLEQALASGS
jgi:hypothetical protein